MGRKKIYPYNRWDNCCYCGKFTLNVIESHDDYRRPHYCVPENGEVSCATKRHSEVRKGNLPPVTSEKIRKVRKAYYEKNKAAGYADGKKPVVKPRAKKSQRGVESVKGPTPYEEKLWGKK